MQNHWLKKRSLFSGTDDYWVAKAKIINYMKAQGFSDDAFDYDCVINLVENWAYMVYELNVKINQLTEEM